MSYWQFCKPVRVCVHAEDEDFLMPVILEGPQAEIALRGHNISLTCVAASSSESKLEIHWRKDNVPITSAKVSGAQHLNPNDLRLICFSVTSLEILQSLYCCHALTTVKCCCITHCV